VSDLSANTLTPVHALSEYTQNSKECRTVTVGYQTLTIGAFVLLQAMVRVRNRGDHSYSITKDYVVGKVQSFLTNASGEHVVALMYPETCSTLIMKYHNLLPWREFSKKFNTTDIHLCSVVDIHSILTVCTVHDENSYVIMEYKEVNHAPQY
jgi:hypothetical protein